MRMLWWQNIPLFLIVAPLMGAVVCSALKEKTARGVMTALSALTVCGMALVLAFTAARQESCVYPMGEVGAPFGNELRFGAVEGIAGLGFSLVILLSHLGYEGGTLDRPSDVIMVENSRNIDLVIGGHSHTYLKEARTVKDLDGKIVPITQCGGQGIAVGTWEITRVRP